MAFRCHEAENLSVESNVGVDRRVILNRDQYEVYDDEKRLSDSV